jgi:hypothetical protein
LDWDNSFFLAPPIKMDPTVMFELFGELLIFRQSKPKARKISELHGPSMQGENFPLQSDGENNQLNILSVGQKRKKTLLQDVPTCTNQVRRSTRCNKYNGFKPKIISDAKATKSKVKPRKTPSATVPVDVEQEELDMTEIAPYSVQVPPITPVPVMQSIGINLCGIPPEDISAKKLLASLQEEESEDSA